MFGNPNCKTKAIQEAVGDMRKCIESGKSPIACHEAANKSFAAKSAACDKKQKKKK
jgi:hypothetical protein